jgi:hypothetical protein
MKKLLIITAALALAISACFDDNPSGPDGDGGEDDGNGGIYPASGSFTIEDTLESNDCVIPVPLSEVIDITISGNLIIFEGISGDWDRDSASGSGTSPETTVPVDPPECNAYYTINFSIVFIDEDHFYGTYGASYRKDNECPNPDPCSYTYRIGGTRN